ncbi:hypothetical protein QBC36DRAFT_391045 [Triangularia setosa]|uniref:Uncharacterized protein n=1 Tax=Triangularia setosa TaxID=2587417 RepID=A0AAN6VY97_9PEZI|nr:hypothetical protein QBC36DRAFT_391045 [Podospora setosa]
MAAIRSFLVVWACLLVWFTAAASNAEDFTNNMISDLGPLLSLFGERVTNQFMTGSMGWADNVILAMAPLGIVTIMVAAIRVGGAGNRWQSAEMELMSSTSRDVSELWNGQGLVRVAGKGPVHQFIIMPSSSPTTTDVVGSVLKHPEPTERSSSGFIKSFFAMLSPNRHRERLVNLNKTEDCNPPLKLDESSGKPPKSLIIFEESDAAPNISLNVYGSSKFELRVLAAAVLAFCGWTAYWLHEPGSILLKDEEPVDRYAFPCTLIGTILLVVGLVLCSHVVESRTIETNFHAADKTSGRLLWIQRAATVNDQAFGSFALFVDKDPFVLKTSRRANTVGARTKTNEGLKAFRQTETTIAVAIGLVGFVVQFVGLRGMSWSAALAQLLATLAMTAIRAWARRESDASFHAVSLDPGFELDWVAVNIGPYGEMEKGLIAGDMSSSSSDNKSHHLSTKTNCHGVFQARANLASLVGKPSSWPRVGASEAINLVKAIEKTLDLLLKDEDQFTWKHRTFNNGTIELRAEKKQGKWQAEQLVSTLEAALSLWHFSVDKWTPNTLDGGDASDSKPRVGDDWLTSKQSSLVLLDPWSYNLIKDLYYWLPANIAGSVVAAKKLESSTTKPPAESTGPDNSRDESSVDPPPAKYKRILEHRVIGLGGSMSPGVYGVGESLWNFEQQPETPMIIAAEVSTSLKSLHVQHTYAVFLQALSRIIPELLNDEPTWWEKKASSQSTGILSNNSISNLVQSLQDILFFTPGEAYFAIIPALSKSKKLAKPEVMLHHAMLESHHNRRCDEVVPKLLSRLRDKEFVHFEHAPRYLRADLTKRISALLWSSVNLVSFKSFLWEDNKGILFHYDHRKLRSFRLPYSKATAHAVEDWSYNHAHDLHNWMLSYIWQGRLDPHHHIRNWPLYENVQGEGEKGKRYHRRMLEYCEHNKLHQAFRNGSQEEIDAALLGGGDIGEQDICGWTVLHYAAVFMTSDADPRFLAAVDIMKDTSGLVIARDLIGWTPLHYAARNPNSGGLVDHLLAKSKAADYKIQLALDLSTPLHCAAESGLVTHIKRLEIFGTEQEWFNRLDHMGFTPLHQAILGGHVKATRAILAAIKRVWTRKEYWLILQQRLTYFHFAVWSGKKEILELFPADEKLIGDLITWADANGLTPLHMAVAGGKTDFVKALIERFTHGPEQDEEQLSRQDEAGYTPLDIAKQQGSDEICTLLEEAGAKKGNPKPDMVVWDREDMMQPLT